MEKDYYISLGDSFIELEGGEKEVTHFTDDILNEKKGNTHKIVTQNSCKNNGKESQKISKINLFF